LFEELGVLYRGLILGLMLAAPVGPVGLLCIRRTIRKGLFTGFASGFGAAFADALFGACAAFGVAAIIDLMRTYSQSIHVVGGIILLIGAWHTWRDEPHEPHPEIIEAKVNGRLGEAAKALISSFVITLTNPVTLFATLAVVAAFGGLHNSREASIIVLGIFAGSSLWWLVLSGGVSLVRHRFTENSVVWINRGTSVALAVIALWAMGSGILGNLGYEKIF
jgi:threonine/homoserine/homoserine lactone efflux protein